MYLYHPCNLLLRGVRDAEDDDNNGSDVDAEVCPLRVVGTLKLKGKNLKGIVVVTAMKEYSEGSTGRGESHVPCPCPGPGGVK